MNEGPYKPLIHATLHNNHRFVKLLLEAGADVNAMDREGRMTLLSLTLVTHSSTTGKCAHYLLKAGADVNKTANGSNVVMSYLNRNFNTDERFLKLLHAAGEVVDWKELGKNARIHAHTVPLWLKDVERRSGQQQQPCLKDQCRVSIRAHLLSIDLFSNLFVRVPKLGLPTLLTRYLLYHMALDTCEDDSH